MVDDATSDAAPTTSDDAAPATAATLRQSPLHDRHVAAGAKLGDFGGWLMPLEYAHGGVLKEHAAVREQVGLFDVSHLGKVHVSGPGSAAQYLNQRLTNDLNRVTPGQAQYSMLCNDAGGVIDDLIVYLHSSDGVLVIPNAANTAAVVASLVEQAPDGVAISNEHLRYAVLAVQGPRADEVMAAVGLPSAATVPDLSYMSFVEVTWNDRPIVVCRSGYSGERGYELLVGWDDADAIWDALAGAVHDRAGRLVGLAARDTLRTEMGYPLHGQDLSPSITPVQARAGWAVGWDKPRFDGRDSLVDERAAGPRRILRGLRATDRGIPRPHMTVRRDGVDVGELTSGTFSPTLRVGIGLALLSPEVSEGDQVVVDVRGRESVMDVVRPPFVPSHVH